MIKKLPLSIKVLCRIFRGFFVVNEITCYVEKKFHLNDRI